MKGVKWCVKFGVALLTLFIVSVINAANTRAYELTTEVKATGESWETSSVRCILKKNGSVSVYTYNNPTRIAGNDTLSTGGNNLGQLNAITTGTTIHVKKGYYYRFNISVQWPNMDGIPGLLWYPATTPNFTLITNNQISVSETPPIESSSGTILTTTYSYLYDVTLRAEVDGDVFVAFGNGTNTLIYVPNFTIGANPTNPVIDLKAFVSMGTIYEYKEVSNPDEKMNEKDDQDRQNMQDLVNESESSADDSSTAAESTGTTMLKAFSDFVGALTSASPSDCSLNMNMGNLNLGNVNLCSLSVPAPLQAISSIVLIGFCVPLSLATAKKIISLFRSFQN